MAITRTTGGTSHLTDGSRDFGVVSFGTTDPGIVVAAIFLRFSSASSNRAVTAATLDGASADVLRSGGEGYISVALVQFDSPGGSSGDFEFSCDDDANLTDAYLQVVSVNGANPTQYDFGSNYTGGNVSGLDVPAGGLSLGALSCQDSSVSAPSNTTAIVDDFQFANRGGESGYATLDETTTEDASFNFNWFPGNGDEAGVAIVFEESSSQTYTLSAARLSATGTISAADVPVARGIGAAKLTATGAFSAADLTPQRAIAAARLSATGAFSQIGLDVDANLEGVADATQGLSAAVSSLFQFDGNASASQRLSAAATVTAGPSVSFKQTATIAVVGRTHPDVAAESQQLEQDAIIELFELTLPSGEVLRFTSATASNGPVGFGGQKYRPMPVEASGFEWSGEGAPPQPKIRLANITQGQSTTEPLPAWSALLIEFDDLIGATIRRKRTYRRFLDDGASPDPTATLAVEDVYRIEQKSQQNRVFIEWRLASSFDQEGRQIPGRLAYRNACQARYRIWNDQTGEFEIADVLPCPYDGDQYFDADGNEVSDPADDVCGLRLVDCRLRFDPEPLPFYGFPALSKMQ